MFNTPYTAVYLTLLIEFTHKYARVYTNTKEFTIYLTFQNGGAFLGADPKAPIFFKYDIK